MYGNNPSAEAKLGTDACAGATADLARTQLMQAAYLVRVDLSAHAPDATPDLAFDCGKETDRPFVFHAYGAAITEVTPDCLRATATVVTARIDRSFRARSAYFLAR